VLKEVFFLRAALIFFGSERALGAARRASKFAHCHFSPFVKMQSCQKIMCTVCSPQRFFCLRRAGSTIGGSKSLAWRLYSKRGARGSSLSDVIDGYHSRLSAANRCFLLGGGSALLFSAARPLPQTHLTKLCRTPPRPPSFLLGCPHSLQVFGLTSSGALISEAALEVEAEAGAMVFRRRA
jgi:hypothetical protein